MLISTAALLGFGLWARYPGLVGLGAVLAVALGCALVTVLVPAPLRIRRRVRPPRVARLEEASAHVEVTNASTWLAQSVTGHDLVGGRRTPFLVPRMAPGATVSTEVPIPTTHRGVIGFGPLTLHRFSFLDLLEVRQEHGDRASVLVEPRILDALGLPAGARRGHVGADERIAHGGTDLVGLREYVAGDDLRRLHWATSARRATLMVREDADPSAPHLTVLLDDRADSYAGAHDAALDGEGFEEAVDVAASLLTAAAGVESPARVVTIGGGLDEQIPAPAPAAGPAGLDPHVLGALARLERSDGGHGSGLFAGSPDVLAVITGPNSDLGDLLLTASGAPSGVVLVVDPRPEALVSAQQGVLVLRGPRAEELVHGWRTAVAR
ncbi:DUF58 domain-containing protein [Occultella glacieicola]|uniref:DUF58 domain-containing protein n=1 Tax=Occultella glacieicola TaxID=2518684 RepID=A0ABY2E0N5_9MICO|nr:DUF58 domain-containing protein [Occultella glacieicola]TDE91493.1 DUF58 domain-containing protein [Occultella glacieicola]